MSAVNCFTQNMSLVEMLAAGKYNVANEQFTEENFPIRSGEMTLPHLHDFGPDFNYKVSFDDFIKQLDILGLRPATLAEFLYFGAVCSEEEKKYPVVALIQEVWMYEETRFVPVIYDNGNRVIELINWSITSDTCWEIQGLHHPLKDGQHSFSYSTPYPYWYFAVVLK